jgi:HAD superfamily hydrolase (TIGR01509 family)
LYNELLAVTGGKERIRYFIEAFGAPAVPSGGLDEFIPSLHAAKTAAYTTMVSGGEVDLRPGVKALIENARERGYRLAIATTTTPANVDALLEVTLGGNGDFEVICAGDSVANKKPAPDVYELTLERMGLPAEACVALEDSRNGVLSAVAAGIPAVVTPGIYTTNHDFTEAAFVISDLETFDFEKIYELTLPAA